MDGFRVQHPRQLLDRGQGHVVGVRDFPPGDSLKPIYGERCLGGNGSSYQVLEIPHGVNSWRPATPPSLRKTMRVAARRWR